MDIHTPINLYDLPTSESYARHQRQRFWQILAPVLFGTLLILVVLGLVIYTAVGVDSGSSVSQWADTSVIWLSLPALLFALILAVILFMMVFLLARLLKILPHYTLNLQYYASVISRSILNGADKMVAPIMTIQGFGARMSALINALLGRHRD